MDWKRKVTELIEGFITQYIEENRTPMRWKSPLVGFAPASSPEFENLRSLVHPEHALPCQLLPGATTVVSYFLPYPEEIAATNGSYGDREQNPASGEWAMAYRETSILFVHLNNAVTSALQGLDEEGRAVSESGKPGILTALPLSFASTDNETMTSRWSHRHVARIAGLGGFGLNNMLISAKGCCGRYSSFLTSLPGPFHIPQAEEACLYRRSGGKACGLCISRCAFGALTKEGFDRIRCSKVCEHNQQVHDPDMKYTTDSEVCGKCLIDLPCSFSRP